MFRTGWRQWNEAITWNHADWQVKGRRRLFALPRVEMLEDRTVPAVFVVNTFDDVLNSEDNLLSLREAIIGSNTSGEVNDTILLQSGTYNLSLVGSNEDASATGDLDITKLSGSVTIQGQAAGATFIDAGTLNTLGQPDRVLDIVSLGITVNLNGLTIQNGRAVSVGNTNGGGILIGNGGTLNVINSMIRNNEVNGLQGGGAAGGGVTNIRGTLLVANSTISGNQAIGADDYGGGAAYGGGIYNFAGNVTISDNSFITGNQANGGDEYGGNPGIGASGDGGGIYNDDGTLALINSTVSDNEANGGATISGGEGALGGFARGGGIYNDGDLDITNSIISGNTATGGSSGAYGGTTYGGGIANFMAGFEGGANAVHITGSTISGNRALGGDGYYAGGALGGGISNTNYFYSNGPEAWEVVISTSTIADNTARGGEGLFGGDASGGGIDNELNGLQASQGSVRIARSTISGNVAEGGEGYNQGGNAYGGGINNFVYFRQGSSAEAVTISNSTISDNSASGGDGLEGQGPTSPGRGNGGGIANHVRGSAAAPSTVLLVNDTITDNSATAGTADYGGQGPSIGGGVFNFLGGEGGSIGVLNTIIALNTATDGAPDAAGTSDSLGHNLIGDDIGSNGFVDGVNDDQVGTSEAPIDPLLGPLQSNGGPTRTHALLLGSPAIDAGDDAVLGPPFNLTTDQRGLPRRAAAHVDIGAFERQVLPGSRIIVTGVDAGAPTHVRVFDAITREERFGFFAYEGFTFGVRVAAGDVNNDGFPDILTVPGPGGDPHVRVIDGITRKELHSFYAFDDPGVPLFKGGLFVAAGDVNGDGFADIIVGADRGGPRVEVYSGLDGSVLHNFYVFDKSLSVGARVGAGLVNGDNRADIIVGAGLGGGPHVRVLDGMTREEIASFYAFDEKFTGGVFVAGGDVAGDGRADVIVGVGPGIGPQVRVVDVNNGKSILADFQAFDRPPGVQPKFSEDPHLLSGVRVGAVDADDDGRADIITGRGGKGIDPLVRIFIGFTKQELDSFFAYALTVKNDIFVGGG